jgi:hypothetical protein
LGGLGTSKEKIKVGVRRKVLKIDELGVSKE